MANDIAILSTPIIFLSEIYLQQFVKLQVTSSPTFLKFTTPRCYEALQLRKRQCNFLRKKCNTCDKMMTEVPVVPVAGAVVTALTVLTEGTVAVVCDSMVNVVGIAVLSVKHIHENMLQRYFQLLHSIHKNA